MQAIVSIIIPHYNRTQLLLATIKSVQQQTYTFIEVIVVDDGSSEVEKQQLHILSELYGFRIIHRATLPKGPSHCRNIGVQHCEGSYLLFLDSDDLLAPFCVEQRVAALQNNPQTKVGIFRMATFTNDTEINDHQIYNKLVPTHDWVAGFITNDNPWNVTCPLWKKEVFEAIGGFNEDFIFMEDPEIHLRLIAQHQTSIQLFYNLPVDSFYRVNNFDDSKVDFYYNSIYYRIEFYKKLQQSSVLKPFLQQHIASFKIGILKIAHQFLFARATQFPALLDSYIALIQQSNLFTKYKKKIIFSLLRIASSTSTLVQKLHLKGLAYKLFPKN